MAPAASSRRPLDGFDRVFLSTRSRGHSQPPSPRRSNTGARRALLRASSAATLGGIEVSMSSTRNETCWSPSFMSPLASSGSSMWTHLGAGTGAAAALAHRPEPLNTASSPRAGRCEQSSRTDLLDACRDATSSLDVGGAASLGVEAELAVLRRSLDDTRAIMRDLQRQQRQELQRRAEVDEALESFKAKLSGLVTRDALEMQLQDIRKSADRRLTEAARDVARRNDSLESSIEAVRASVMEASVLNGDFGNSRGKLDASHSSPLHVGHQDSKLELRLSSLEQQTARLFSQIAGLGSQTEDEAMSVAEGAVRQSETVERRADALEAEHDNLQKKCNKLAQDMRALHDATESERERYVQLQQSLEEFRERITGSYNTSLANHGLLETTVEQQRLKLDEQRVKLDEESRARQWALRELEEHVACVAADAENSSGEAKAAAEEAKAAATAATSATAADVEGRLEACQQKSSEQMQQVIARVRKVEEATNSLETITGSNAMAMLERVAKLEGSVNDSVSKFDRLESWFEDRATDLHRSLETMTEHKSADAVASLVARLGTQRVEADRRWEQLQREVKTLGGALDALKDSQQRSAPMQTLDVGRLELEQQQRQEGLRQEMRQEVRRNTEELASKLRKVVDDLDCRLKDLEPAFKDLRDMGQRLRELEKMSDRLEPRLNCVDTCVKNIKDVDSRLKDVDSRLHEMEPRVRYAPESPPVASVPDPRLNDFEHRLRDLEPRMSKSAFEVEFRFKELEARLSDLKEIEPRMRSLEPLLLRLEPQVKDLEARFKEVEPRTRELEPRLKELVKELEPRIKELEPRIKELEPRIRDLEPRVKELEPRLKELEPRIKELEPRVRDCERELAPRILKDIEPRLSRLQDIEPRINGLELRLRELEPRIKEFEPRLLRLQDIEPRLKELEPKMREIEPRVKELEPRIKELEPRMTELHGCMASLQPWLKTFEPQFVSLQQTVKSMEPRISTIATVESQLRDIEPRMRSLVLELEHKVSEATDSFFNLQRHSEDQLGECMASVRTESASWRDALRTESAAWTKACGELRCRSESARDEMQQSLLEIREVASRASTEWRSESAAEKVRVGQLTESLADLRKTFKEKTEEASAKLEAKLENKISQSLTEVGWRLSRRIDEVDACAGDASACASEARAAVDYHQRQVAALERVLEAVRLQTERDKGDKERNREGAAKEVARIVDDHRQGIITQAVSQAVPQVMDAVRAKLDDAAKATERCEESCRQATRAVAEVADVEKDFKQKFDRWSSQVQEGAQLRLQERLQEMFRNAVADMTVQLSNISERHCEKAIKKSQTEAQAESKEDSRFLRESLKEDIFKVIAEVATKSERSLLDFSNRIETISATLSSITSELTSEISRLDSQDRQQLSQIAQESDGRESLEQGIATLRRGLEHQRIHVNEVCDRILPSLREVQGTLAEEQQSRGEEGQRLQERLREFEGRNNEHISSQRRVDASLRGCEVKLNEGLRDTEAAVLAVDRRLHHLEDALEERLHELVHGELVRGVVSQLESQQLSHLQALESKMDRISHNLHTPSCLETSMRPHLTNTSEDRETFRQRFRDNLGDSLYVKKALHRSNRTKSEICLHNDRERRRGGR